VTPPREPVRPRTPARNILAFHSCCNGLEWEDERVTLTSLIGCLAASILIDSVFYDATDEEDLVCWGGDGESDVILKRFEISLWLSLKCH
jgi:hypothetical protein